MARTATGTASPSTVAVHPRRKSQLAWLRAGDVRLVISHQDAQDRRILKALDTLVKAKPGAPAASAPTRRRKLAA